MRTSKNSKKSELKQIFPSVAELSAMVEASKAEAPKAEAPKAEAPKAEASKAEAPKAEAPKAEAPKAEAPKAEAPKAEAPKAEAPKGINFETPVVKSLSLDELTDKAERVYLLKQKYAEIREKKQRLERFTIKNDYDTASLTLRDARGETITTHNPRAIGNLLADWAKDLSERLAKVEEELRKELGA